MEEMDRCLATGLRYTELAYLPQGPLSLLSLLLPYV